MSTKQYIAIYSNVPPGGAKKLRDSNISYFKNNNIKFNHFVGKQINIYSNFLFYIFHVIFILPIQHRKLANIINDSKATIFIVYHSWITKSPILMRYIKNIKIIYICHESLREYYDQQHIVKQSKKDKLINLLRLPIKHIDSKNIHNADNLLVITNSKFSKKKIDQIYGINSVVVYPGILIEEYASKKIRKFTKKTKYVAISIGAISKFKNQEYLIKSIAKISKNNRPSLILVGNTEEKHYRQHLLELANSNNVNLTIKFNISKSQMIQELNSADIFLYSPISEPFGLVILEAMATGLPIVAIRNGGGYVEVLTKENAILSSPVNPKIFAKDILALLKDVKRRSKMSSNNLKDVKKYSSNLMNKKLFKIIQHHASQPTPHN